MPTSPGRRRMPGPGSSRTGARTSPCVTGYPGTPDALRRRPARAPGGSSGSDRCGRFRPRPRPAPRHAASRRGRACPARALPRRPRRRIGRAARAASSNATSPRSDRRPGRWYRDGVSTCSGRCPSRRLSRQHRDPVARPARPDRAGRRRGVLHETAYPAIELVIVDNGSTDPAVLAHYETLRARSAGTHRAVSGGRSTSRR